jgi:YfiH family protein
LVSSRDSSTMAFAIGPPNRADRRADRLVAIVDGDVVTAIRYCRQIHGAVVHHVDDPSGRVCEVGDGDALVTTTPGLGIAVWTADCVPILLRGPGVVAAVHAGWRGCAADVVGAAVRQIGARQRCPPGELTAALGPAVCGSCYEVGAEVRRALRRFGLDEARWCDRERVDLRAFLTARLEALGVAADRIATVGGCTIESAELASYRRDGDVAGRQWSLVVLTGEK